MVTTTGISYGSAKGRELWALYTRAYPKVPVIILAVVILSIAASLYFNMTGLRMWNVGLSLIPAILGILLLLHPTLLKWLFFIGIADKLTDREPNTPREVVLGSEDDWTWLAHKIAHVALLFQVLFVVMALKRFENIEAAIIAVVALIGLGLASFLWTASSGIYRKIMRWLWTVLLVVSLGMAFFVPNYFKDETSYLVRHAQGKSESARREAQRNVLLVKERSGQSLTLDDRRKLQKMDDHERAIDAYIPTEVVRSFKLRDGLGEREFQIPITPGRYTCKAELTAREPADLRVIVSGIGIDLATTVYVNDRPCNGNAEVTFGPDGKAMLHFNLDKDVRATVRGASRWVMVTFTPRVIIRKW